MEEIRILRITWWFSEKILVICDRLWEKVHLAFSTQWWKTQNTTRWFQKSPHWDRGFNAVHHAPVARITARTLWDGVATTLNCSAMISPSNGCVWWRACIIKVSFYGGEVGGIRVEIALKSQCPRSELFFQRIFITALKKLSVPSPKDGHN